MHPRQQQVTCTASHPALNAGAPHHPHSARCRLQSTKTRDKDAPLCDKPPKALHVLHVLVARLLDRHHDFLLHAHFQGLLVHIVPLLGLRYRVLFLKGAQCRGACTGCQGVWESVGNKERKKQLKMRTRGKTIGRTPMGVAIGCIYPRIYIYIHIHGTYGRAVSVQCVGSCLHAQSNPFTDCEFQPKLLSRCWNELWQPGVIREHTSPSHTAVAMQTSFSSSAIRVSRS